MPVPPRIRGGSAVDQLPSPERAALVARIDSIVNKPIASGKIAGASVAVVKGQDTILIKGYGKADLEFDVATPQDAIYEIGSVTKQFTAVAIMLLAEQGKLSLDDDITKFFPGYNSQGNKIPVRRLLDHTSGIKGYTEIPEFGRIGLTDAPQDTLVGIFSKKPFDFKTGEEEIYNNSAYFLAGLIIEKLSGKSYADFVKENLFDKAGMTNSRYCSESADHQESRARVRRGRHHGDAHPGPLPQPRGPTPRARSAPRCATWSSGTTRCTTADPAAGVVRRADHPLDAQRRHQAPVCQGPRAGPARGAARHLARRRHQRIHLAQSLAAG